jgi:hypothetical protein
MRAMHIPIAVLCDSLLIVLGKLSCVYAEHTILQVFCVVLH